MDVEGRILIEGFACEPEAITRALGVGPTKLNRAGDDFGRSIMRWKASRWVLDTDEEPDRELAQQIEPLLQKLPADLSALRSISAGWQARCSYVVYPSRRLPR